MQKYLYILIFFMSLVGNSYAAITRNEVDRFILLNDKTFIYRNINRPRTDKVFNFDLQVSSGLKTLVGDLKSASTDSNANSSQKQTNTLSILNRSINTEKYLDLDLHLFIPIPVFTFFNLNFMTKVYGAFLLADSLSITNQSSNFTNPTLQNYLKWDRRYGVNINLGYHEQKRLIIDLSHVIRKDLFSSLDATAIIQKSEIIKTDDLNKKEKILMLNLGYLYKIKHYAFLFNMYDFKLKRTVDQGKPTPYGYSPLFDIRWKGQWYTDNTKFDIYTGLHYRKHYPLRSSLYFGGTVIGLSNPFKLTGIIDGHFLSLTPGLEFKYIQFGYHLRLPIYNPQQNLWVALIHGPFLTAHYSW